MTASTGTDRGTARDAAEGSTGTARVTVELVDGRARLVELVGSVHLRPRPVLVDGPLARVALVGTFALLLAGDDVRVELRVGAGVVLELIEPSGVVAYDVRGGDGASWAVHATVGEGGALVWKGAPFVVTEGADVERGTAVELAAGARALISETLVLGRADEPGGGPLRSRFRARLDGRPLLVEDLDLRDPWLAASPGVVGAHRVVASVMLLGTRPDAADGEGETLLAGPGALGRVLAPHAHEADAVVDATWARWRPLVAA
ncbi:urease accessory protein UreD [Isoptericola sp. NPDC058082]|uniref:urease accessory protein UreD n=1 Tax=Isoptericola sp. NPDC058082 TaxID=3346331 RepID=UPI0036E6551A